MPKTLIGYARCSTDKQDLSAQREALTDLGVAAERIYVDHGLTGTNRARPGLNQALAAVRKGDTLVVPKLDRLARSVPDARSIADDLAARGRDAGTRPKPLRPVRSHGQNVLQHLATFAEFEADLIRLRTREGMKIARAKGRLRGKQPKLSDKQQKELSACMERASTRSATWRSYSLSLVQPSTGRSCVLPDRNVSLLSWKHIGLFA
jgi:DNA invertase Pin-like site-specific DNA recombinase